MELGNRKNEAKNELKRQDIVIEVGCSRAHVLHRPDESPSPCTTEQWGHWVISGQRSRKRNGTTCENLSVSPQQHVLSMCFRDRHHYSRSFVFRCPYPRGHGVLRSFQVEETEGGRASSTSTMGPESEVASTVPGSIRSCR